MSSTSLSSLPSELLLAIFTSLDGFPSLASLSRVSPRFHEIWESNTHIICREIAMRTVGFAEAFELAELQAGVPGVMNELPRSCSSRKEASIAHARHLAANHRIVLLACESWVSRLNIPQGYRGPLSVSCRGQLRLQQAYYLLELLTLLPEFSLSLTKRLEQTSLRALEGAYLVSEWLRREPPVDVLLRLGFTTVEEACKNGFKRRDLLKKAKKAYKVIRWHRTMKQRRLLGKHPPFLDPKDLTFSDDQLYYLDERADLC